MKSSNAVYKIVAEFKAATVRIPTFAVLLNGGKTLTGISKQKIVDKDGKKITIQKYLRNGMPLDSGLILNRNFFGFTVADAGKTVVGNVKVIEKTTTNGETFTLLDIFKSRAKTAKGKLQFTKTPVNGDIPIAQSPEQCIHFEKYQQTTVTCADCGTKKKLNKPHDQERLGPYKCPTCRGKP